MALLDFSLNDVGGVIRGIREAITGERIKDPVEMAKVELQLQQLENALMTGQLKINEAEATHPNVFVAGWRPAIGWTGAVALTYQFVLYPFMMWALVLAGVDLAKAPPVLDSGPLFALVTGMLGIGGLRSFDKLKQTDTKKMGG